MQQLWQPWASVHKLHCMGWHSQCIKHSSANKSICTFLPVGWSGTHLREGLAHTIALQLLLAMLENVYKDKTHFHALSCKDKGGVCCGAASFHLGNWLCSLILFLTSCECLCSLCRLYCGIGACLSVSVSVTASPFVLRYELDLSINCCITSCNQTLDHKGWSDLS